MGEGEVALAAGPGEVGEDPLQDRGRVPEVAAEQVEVPDVVLHHGHVRGAHRGEDRGAPLVERLGVVEAAFGAGEVAADQGGDGLADAVADGREVALGLRHPRWAAGAVGVELQVRHAEQAARVSGPVAALGVAREGRLVARARVVAAGGLLEHLGDPVIAAGGAAAVSGGGEEGARLLEEGDALGGPARHLRVLGARMEGFGQQIVVPVGTGGGLGAVDEGPGVADVGHAAEHHRAAHPPPGAPRIRLGEREPVDPPVAAIEQREGLRVVARLVALPRRGERGGERRLEIAGGLPVPGHPRGDPRAAPRPSAVAQARWCASQRPSSRACRARLSTSIPWQKAHEGPRVGSARAAPGPGRARRGRRPAAAAARVHSIALTTPPRIAPSSTAATAGAVTTARVTRRSHSALMSAGTSAAAPPASASANPPSPASSSPRCTQSPTSCTAKSGLPLVRRVTSATSADESPSSPRTSSPCRSSSRGASASVSTSPRAASAARAAASAGRSWSASSETPSTQSAGSPEAQSSATNASASGAHCASSIRISAGRSRPTSSTSRHSARRRSFAPAKRTRGVPSSSPSARGCVISRSGAASSGAPPSRPQGGVGHRRRLGPRQPRRAEEARRHRAEALTAARRRGMEGAEHGRGAHLARPGREPLPEPRLAHPRRPAHQHHPGRSPRMDRAQRCPEHVPLPLPPHEGNRTQREQPQPGPRQRRRAHRRARRPPRGWKRRRSAPIALHRVGHPFPSRRLRCLPRHRPVDGQREEPRRLLADRDGRHVHPRPGRRVAQIDERRRRIGRAAEAVSRRLGQHAAEPRAEALGHGDLAAQRRHRRGLVSPQRLLHADPRLPEGRPPAGEAVGEAPDGVEIGPWPEPVQGAVDLLWRHVVRRPREPVSQGRGVLVEPVGDAEVGELDGAGRGAQEHVPRLDVAVDDAAGVGVGERVEQAEEHGAEPGPGEAGGHVVQGAVRHQLHHEVRRPRDDRAEAPRDRRSGDLALVEDHHDARVIERRRRAHLVAKRRAERVVRGERAPDDLDRHRHARADVDPAMDRAHGAAADHAVEAEASEQDGS